MIFGPNYKSNFPKCFKAQSKPHKFCPGCGHGIALKSLGYAIDEHKINKKTIIGVDIGCSLLAWDFFDLNTIQAHHGRTIPVIAGYKMVKPHQVGIAYMGDGGAYAIGLQSLIHSAYRNDPITVIVINNTLYGMTGGQMAPTTLEKQKTTTTPEGKLISPLLGPELLQTLPNKKMFLARGIVNQPLMLQELFKNALDHQIKNHSFSFVEVLSMCPVNWKKNAKESLEFLENQMVKDFPLGVLDNGQKR